MPRVMVNGISLFYRVDGQGEPLVLITGFGGGHEGWLFQRRAFQRHFKVVSFDNRGAGRTDKPAASYTIRTMAHDAVALMDSLGIETAHILGMSQGGMIAQEVGISYPERVRKLVLVCTTPGENHAEHVNPELLRAMGFNENATPEDIKSIDLKKCMKGVTCLALNNPVYRLAVRALSLFPRDGKFEGLAGQMEATVGFNTRERLQQIKAPTLVLAGTNDRIIPVDRSRLIADSIPGAKLVLIKNGSHALNFENMRRFNREVIRFLRGAEE